MTATGYILPADVDLEALIGGDFTTTISLYSDLDQTTVFDLAGYTVSMIIGDLYTLTSGSGLTIGTAGGTIVAALTAAQTGAQSPRHPPLSVHYQLKLVDGSGVVSYPLSGKFTLEEA